MMDLSWLGNVISAAGSHIDSMANGLNQRWVVKEQNRLNRQMMKEYNEYNSPKNQMMRFLEAGLNPNLMYGSISPGNQSAPTEQGVPDYSEAIQYNDAAFKHMGEAFIKHQQYRQWKKQMELNEKNLELQGKRLDNEIERTDIRRSMANLAIRKGDYQMASMFLDNKWKSLTMYDRVKAERWRQELMGYKTDTARAEAAFAPDFYDLRNRQMKKNMWWLGQKASLGWSELGFKNSKWSDEKKYLSHKETWSAYYKNEVIKATKERINLQKEMVRIAKDAETRKQREQVLHYLFEYLNHLEHSFETAGELFLPKF